MAAGGEVVAKYVGHKVAKTRWSPPQQGSIVSSDTFATGGWDDEVRCLGRFSKCQSFLLKVESVLRGHPSGNCEVAVK